jgi:hypothetical protein
MTLPSVEVVALFFAQNFFGPERARKKNKKRKIPDKMSILKQNIFTSGLPFKALERRKKKRKN